MLTVLGGLAAFERELILARTSEGRVRAKARGVTLGRRPKPTPYQQREARSRRANGESLTEIARSYNVSHSTISRLPPREHCRVEHSLLCRLSSDQHPQAYSGLGR